MGRREFQHWFGVGEVAREEAEAAAHARLARLIDEDEDIALPALAAKGPGPLVSTLAGERAGAFPIPIPIPIAIVPGHLSDAEIDRLT